MEVIEHVWHQTDFVGDENEHEQGDNKRSHKFASFKHFVSPSPAFLPLHLMDEVTKPLTMALRLFGNILAGEILLIVLYQLAPWVVPELWVMFSLFIGFLQAFIFTMLTLTSFATVFAHHE